MTVKQGDKFISNKNKDTYVLCAYKITINDLASMAMLVNMTTGSIYEHPKAVKNADKITEVEWNSICSKNTSYFKNENGSEVFFNKTVGIQNNQRISILGELYESGIIGLIHIDNLKNIMPETKKSIINYLKLLDQ